MRPSNLIIAIIPVWFFLAAGCNSPKSEPLSDRIQPYMENPVYWQYKSKPVLLLGGSSNDNIFQHTANDLEDELERLLTYGGNYIRCTLSSRDGGDLYPYYKDTITQMYDLEQWGDEYWEKFDFFLSETYKRNIIVQLEIWETYDFYTREWHLVNGQTPWERNPFNPKNNINYTEDESGLSHNFFSRGYSLINPFFYTVLPLPRPYDFNMKPMVLGFQQKFVDKLLSISLKYDHVLYVIDNETNTVPEWSIYWSEYIKKRTSSGNIDIEVTEMWDTFDPTDGAVEGAIVQNPATHFFTRRASVSNTLYDTVSYSYVDISNNNFQEGETHYLTGLYIWKEIQKSGALRPINNTKIYGADDIGWATHQEGVERFWRNIFAGAASARFHRPPFGLGHQEIAMVNVKSMRMLTDSINFFSCYPANELLSEKETNEAYCMANNHGEYILYFPSNAHVKLNIKPGKYEVKWLNIKLSAWMEPEILQFPSMVKTPDDDMWAAAIVKI